MKINLKKSISIILCVALLLGSFMQAQKVLAGDIPAVQDETISEVQTEAESTFSEEEEILDDAAVKTDAEVQTGEDRTGEDIQAEGDIADAAEIQASGGVTASGSCGGNVTWTLYNDGELVISGSGGMEYDLWEDYSDNITKVTVQSGVTALSEGAFSNLTNLTSVSLPSGITSIPFFAFYGDSALESITIPSSVITIEDLAFCHCGLTKVTIPANVENISSGAFCNCQKLTGFSVNKSNRYFSAPDGVLTDADVTRIIAYPCGLTATSYTVPSTVKTIGESAFLCNGILKSVTLPSGLTTLEDSAFDTCSKLAKITIPASVTSIGKDAFMDCSALAEITFRGNAPKIDALAFENVNAKVYYRDKASGWTNSAKDDYGGTLTYIALDESGNPVITSVGWVKSGSKWYYYYEDGSMATGWKKIDSKWYYFESTGVMKTGWLKLSGKWYYLSSGGPMVTGWNTIDGKKYYFNSSGIMLTGWQKLSSKWYYFNTSGAMQTGWQKIDKKWYYFNTAGVMQKNWVKISGKYYYFNSSGVMQTGWLKLDGKWYYLAKGGAMTKGWLKLSGKWYYFKSSGVMQTGWLKLGSYWYYFKSSGVMAADEVVNGYRFDASGHWIKSVKTVKPDDECNRDNVLALLDAYDTDGAYIIRNSSPDSLMFWLGNPSTIEDSLHEMGSAVHEQCHDFCSTPSGLRYNATRDTYTAASEYIYAGEGKYYDVPFTDVFDSYEMAVTIPENLRTFRYDTYVAGDADNVIMASRQYGIYGLMDEFTAYYWGFHDDVAMENYIADNGLSGSSGYSNVFIAYAEFRYYILSYMIYAKTHYPSVYNQILANETLRKAFSNTESRFGAEVKAWLNDNNLDWFCESTGYNALMAEMDKAEYRQMFNLLQP